MINGVEDILLENCGYLSVKFIHVVSNFIDTFLLIYVFIQRNIVVA